MNNTELTLDQLAEVAGGPHYTTYGGTTHDFTSAARLKAFSPNVVGRIVDQQAKLEIAQGVAKNVTDHLRVLVKRIG